MRKGKGNTRRKIMLRHYAHQSGKCMYCKIDMYIDSSRKPGPRLPHAATLEHILPRLYGRTDGSAATVVICLQCNSRRAHRPLHWSLLFNVLVHKPMLTWSRIIQMHITNIRGFDKKCMGYSHMGAFKPQDVYESKRARKARRRQEQLLLKIS